MLRSRELNLMSHWALNPVDETLREMIACSLDVFGFIVVGSGLCPHQSTDRVLAGTRDSVRAEGPMPRSEQFKI